MPTNYKDRYQAAQQDYLRDLIERLQALEYQERLLALQNPPMPYDYQSNDVQDYSNQQEAKRGWWGKRAAAGGDNWNKFRGRYLRGACHTTHDIFLIAAVILSFAGSWGKREQSWNNLKGLWG